jgi:uncharacterized protein YukE
MLHPTQLSSNASSAEFNIQFQTIYSNMCKLETLLINLHNKIDNIEQKLTV